MAVIAGPIQTAYQTPDYSPVIEANRLAGMQQQQIMQGAVGQVTDYFKQQGEKKKLIKQSDVQIDAALKLFPDLAPTLQGVRDQIRDENVPLNDRAAVAESVAGLVNMGISTMRDQSNQILEQQKLRQNAEYQSQQLQIAQQNANSRAASAIAAGQQPPKTLEVPVEGGTQTMQWDANSGSYIPIQVSGYNVAQSIDGLLSVPTTNYSQGAAVGGPDEMQDKWTNQGFTATGKNLTKGVVAVNPEVFPLGTVFRDPSTNEVFIAADKHGNEDRTVIDIYKPPGEYKQVKENRDFEIIGTVTPGKTPEEIRAQLEEISAALNKPNTAVAAAGQEAPAPPPRGQAAQPQPRVGFKPSETKTFRPATPEEAKPYGGGFGQIDTSTGQFYPITQSSNEKGSFRPATEQESVAYGGIRGQIDTKTGRFYALPQPDRADSRARDEQMYVEAREAYRRGDIDSALAKANSLRLKGLYGGYVTADDLPDLFKNPELPESPAPAPAAPPQGVRPPLDSIIPNVRPR